MPLRFDASHGQYQSIGMIARSPVASRSRRVYRLVTTTGPVHSALPVEDKMNHHPMTKEQRESLDHQLAIIMEKLGDNAILLNARYGARTSV